LNSICDFQTVKKKEIFCYKNTCLISSILTCIYVFIFSLFCFCFILKFFLLKLCELQPYFLQKMLFFANETVCVILCNIFKSETIFIKQKITLSLIHVCSARRDIIFRALCALAAWFFLLSIFLFLFNGNICQLWTETFWWLFF
jgi:hypothetical protein